MTKRFGYTQSGKKVQLNVTRKVDGGWKSYVLNSKGHAVLVFIPGE